MHKCLRFKDRYKIAYNHDGSFDIMRLSDKNSSKYA